jgi:hypothetical protein
MPILFFRDLNANTLRGKIYELIKIGIISYDLFQLEGELPDVNILSFAFYPVLTVFRISSIP